MSAVVRVHGVPDWLADDVLDDAAMRLCLDNIRHDEPMHVDGSGEGFMVRGLVGVLPTGYRAAVEVYSDVIEPKVGQRRRSPDGQVEAILTDLRGGLRGRLQWLHYKGGEAGPVWCTIESVADWEIIGEGDAS